MKAKELIKWLELNPDADIKIARGSMDGDTEWCTLETEYEDLDEQGLLLKLPCRVGNTIYVHGILGVGEAEECKVIRVDYHSNLAMGRSEFYIEALLANAPENSIGFYDKEIGKTVFLTKAEAKKKLKAGGKE